MESIWLIDLDVQGWIIFAVAGIFTGIINTLAGSGSLITLPIFIFICGLPAPIANGTNRIGVFIQSFVGIYAFRKQGILPFAKIGYVLVPAVLGAMVGARIATDLDEATMNLTLAGLMLFMLVILTIKPNRWLRESSGDRSYNMKWYNLLIFFFIGIYGGFIQAGVGLFLLSGLVLGARYTLAQANSIKLLAVAVFSIPALIIFALEDQVYVGYGLLMAIFQSIGAYIGVQFVAKVPGASRWIYGLLVLIVIVSAGKFLWEIWGN